MADKVDGRRRRSSRAILWSTCTLFCASLAWSLTSINEPSRLLFVPLGDVTGGFRSFDGHLEWIEYAGWERNPDIRPCRYPGGVSCPSKAG
jgi:hypothetical protein